MNPIDFTTLAASLPLSDTVRRMVVALPGDNVRVDFDFEWIERYAHVLYPVLAIGTVALVGIAILSWWRNDDITGLAKVEYKREIITILRRELGGLTVEQLAKQLKLSPHRAAKIIHEMHNDGMLEPLPRKNVTLWRVGGLSKS